MALKMNARNEDKIMRSLGPPSFLVMVAGFLIVICGLHTTAYAESEDPFTSTDWVHVGFNIPDVVCAESRSGCVSIDQVPTILRLEVVRWRYDRFQLSLFKLFAGESWARDDERFGAGILGMGQHYRLNAAGTSEFGWLFWLLFGAREHGGGGGLSAQVYYRTQMTWNTLEVGIESTVGCCGRGRNIEQTIYPHSPVPVHLYLQAGF